jgi:hypothetical protein
VDGERFRWGEPFGISGRKVGNQANDRLPNKVTMPNAETSNFDQAGQFSRRANPQLSGDCVEMDTVITHQNGRRKLAGAPSENQIEGEARLPGA